MKPLAKGVLMMVLFASVLFSACAHNKPLKELNSEVVMLHRLGQYSKAVRVAKKALKLGEKRYGPKHPIMITCLNNLAGVYYSQNKYDRAESTYRWALAIAEKSSRPDQPDVVTLLKNMTEFYEKIGKEDEVKWLEEWAKAMRLRHR